MPIAEMIASLMGRAREDLAELVSYRSVADFQHFPKTESDKAASWIATSLTAEGFTDVRVLDTPDGTRSVYGYLPGPPGSKTVLLYAHYDVQPPLDESAWTSPPFRLEPRDGRWYGRGAADCKGAVVMHLTVLRALARQGGAPVNVKVIVEGSEEQGTGGLERYAEANPELLAADAIVVADGGNFRLGVPTIVSSLRGVVIAEVTVETLAGNGHSGLFGGAAPDALPALIRVLDGLHDEEGQVAIKGLDRGRPWTGLQYPENEFRADAKVLDGVDLIGTGTVSDRLWAQPAVAVMGIDCPSVAGATPALQAKASARIALRVAPGTDLQAASDAFLAHLKASAPWHVRITVTERGRGESFQTDVSGPAYEAMAAGLATAYGRPAETVGVGGGIPLCATLAKLYPAAEILIVGLSEPTAQMHAVNESVSPQELERLALAEALFLQAYARS